MMNLFMLCFLYSRRIKVLLCFFFPPNHGRHKHLKSVCWVWLQFFFFSEKLTCMAAFIFLMLGHAPIDQRRLFLSPLRRHQSIHFLSSPQNAVFFSLDTDQRENLKISFKGVTEIILKILPKVSSNYKAKQLKIAKLYNSVNHVCINRRYWQAYIKLFRH